MVHRRDLDYIVIALLFLTGLYALASGLIADIFGYPRFFLHAASGYACAFLAATHLTLNRGRVKAYVRRLIRHRAPPPDSTADEGPRDESSEVARRAQAGVSPLAVTRRTLVASLVSAAAGFALGWLLPGVRPDNEGAGSADPGQTYHELSKPGRALGAGALRDWGPRPAGEKVYPEAERVLLPDPADWNGPSIAQTVDARRSIRTYAGGPMTTADLARLLHAASGITDQARGFRAAPSAGALYPIETYIIAHDVAGLGEGVYHYAPADHALELIRPGDQRAALVVAGIGQDMLGSAQVCLALTAIFQRTRWRYRERAYRYILLEAGHIGQNVYLASTALGLGACAIGAFLDDALNRLLAVDAQEEAAIYLMAVGRT